MEEKNRYIRRFYIAAFIVFALGTALGSLYYVNSFGKSDDIINYLNNFTASIKNGADSKSIVISSIKGNAITYAVFAAAIAFKAGIAVIAAETIRRAFTIGFTVSAFVGSYGIKGALFGAAQLPQRLLMLPALLIFAAVCGACSLRKTDFGKRNKIFLIIFFVIIAAIFCAESFFEGYLTTIFMKFTANMVT